MSQVRSKSTPTRAKKRVASMRQTVADATSAFSLPLLLTMAEAAVAMRLSKPTVIKMVKRGALRTYRPTGRGGVILVHADSVSDHIARHSYGGAR